MANVTRAAIMASALFGVLLITACCEPYEPEPPGERVLEINEGSIQVESHSEVLIVNETTGDTVLSENAKTNHLTNVMTAGLSSGSVDDVDWIAIIFSFYLIGVPDIKGIDTVYKLATYWKGGYDTCDYIGWKTGFRPTQNYQDTLKYYSLLPDNPSLGFPTSWVNAYATEYNLLPLRFTDSVTVYWTIYLDTL